MTTLLLLLLLHILVTRVFLMDMAVLLYDCAFAGVTSPWKRLYSYSPRKIQSIIFHPANFYVQSISLFGITSFALFSSHFSRAKSQH